MEWETIVALIFFACLGVLLYVNRSKLQVQSLIAIGKWPILYALLYRSQWGIAFMDKMAGRFPRLMSFLGITGIGVGFLGMIAIAISLIITLVNLFRVPEAAQGVALVLPFEAPGAIHVPVLYWIISIFLIAIVHEFAHGVIARLYKLKVKSTGFAFFSIIIPLIPAAFVEPDEKQVKKASTKKQLAVYAAGPYSNVIFAALCYLLLAFVMSPIAEKALMSDGVEIVSIRENSPAALAGLPVGGSIQQMDGAKITNVSEFIAAMEKMPINKTAEVIVVHEEIPRSYMVTFTANPDNASRSFFGISVNSNTVVKPEVESKYGKALPAAFLWTLPLMYWLIMLNLGIGLFNLVPLGPLDGGRMMLAVLLAKFEEEKAMKIFKNISLFFLALVLIPLIYGFFQ